MISHYTNDTSSKQDTHTPCAREVVSCISSSRWIQISQITAKAYWAHTVQTGWQAWTCCLTNTHKPTQTPSSPHCLTWCWSDPSCRCSPLRCVGLLSAANISQTQQNSHPDILLHCHPGQQRHSLLHVLPGTHWIWLCVSVMLHWAK